MTKNVWKSEWTNSLKRPLSGLARRRVLVLQLSPILNPSAEFILLIFAPRSHQIGEIESVPERIENGWDRAEDRVENGFDDAVQGVEDIPEDVAGWAGRKVGEVERFGDEVDDAYEEGRYEGREDGW